MVDKSDSSMYASLVCFAMCRASFTGSDKSYGRYLEMKFIHISDYVSDLSPANLRMSCIHTTRAHMVATCTNPVVKFEAYSTGDIYLSSETVFIIEAEVQCKGTEVRKKISPLDSYW